LEHDFLLSCELRWHKDSTCAAKVIEINNDACNARRHTLPTLPFSSPRISGGVSPVAWRRPETLKMNVTRFGKSRYIF
jgi:hypothetical protein